MFTLLSVRSDLDVFEWFLSTLFDASLFETQSRDFRGFFSGPALASTSLYKPVMYRLDLLSWPPSISTGAKILSVWVRKR
jgi:hypothetical protein